MKKKYSTYIFHIRNATLGTHGCRGFNDFSCKKPPLLPEIWETGIVKKNFIKKNVSESGITR